MRIHLDTTYLLPLIGIRVKEISSEDFDKLLEKEFKLYINQISIFELCAKGAKYIAKGLLSMERVIRGVNAIVYGEEFKKVPFNETKVMELSFKVRKLLTDYVDCIILSSAIANCEVLITEDEDILMLRKNRELLRILEEMNPDFKILSLKDFIASST